MRPAEAELIGNLVACCGEASRSIAPLRSALNTVVAAGARPFEVIVGSPWGRFGPRITVESGSDRQAFAEALQLTDLAHGVPEWAGLRLDRAGRLRVKPYHQIIEGAGAPQPPAGLPGPLYPVMVSEFDGSTERYWRLIDARPWSWFAGGCLALLDEPLPVFSPHPKPAAFGFALSVVTRVGRVTAITLYADWRCLPDDDLVARAWIDGMDSADRRAYTLALSGVRAFGPREPPGWHAMLGWSFERGGDRRRAVSLRVPLHPVVRRHADAAAR